MDRRTFVVRLGVTGLGVLTPLTAEAQQAGKVYRIGWLGISTPPAAAQQAFVHTLRANGFVEGHNVVIERRYSEGKSERDAQGAAELSQMRVDVIVATNAAAARAAKAVTATIPIVMVGGNPEQLGLVANLARPGGNVTGISN